jgi:flagellar hook-associated protein 3 FlgL
MRVTDSFTFQTYAATLSTLESQMNTLTNQIASGKKVIVPSDDPAGYAQNMQITAELSQNTQYASNLNSLQANGAYYQTSLNSIGNILTAVQQLAVQMSSATVDASARSTAVDQVNGYIQQLVALGNTKVGDTYIFGGENASGAAYTLDSATNSVTFNGTDNVAKVAVNSSTTIDAGISGNTVFTGTVNGQNVDIFATLQQFGNDLANNDTAALQTDLTNIVNCVDLTANNLAYVGTYTQNISSLLSTNTTAGTTLTQTSDNMVDVNTAQAYSDYTTLSTAYQAALYVMSKAESLSILNYLPAG